MRRSAESVDAGKRRWFARPALVVLLVAPFLGEVLSTATPPLAFVLPWKLVLLAALYGSGALICREVARRNRFGLPGLCLLAAAYAVYEEALIAGTWFDPHYQDVAGVGAYSRVWHTNLLLATHLIAFHVAVSVGSSIVIVERLFPAYRARAWAGRRGLTCAALALVILVPLTYGNVWRGPIGPKAAALGLCVLLTGCAFAVPRGGGRSAPRRSRPRLLGVVAFAGAGTHFVLVYALPPTHLPWPAAIAITLAPIAVAALLVRANGGAHDALPVVTGVLAFFALLDTLVGLGGRYDLTAGGLATLLALWWLNRRGDPVAV